MHRFFLISYHQRGKWKQTTISVKLLADKILREINDPDTGSPVDCCNRIRQPIAKHRWEAMNRNDQAWPKSCDAACDVEGNDPWTRGALGMAVDGRGSNGGGQPRDPMWSIDTSADIWTRRLKHKMRPISTLFPSQSAHKWNQIKPKPREEPFGIGLDRLITNTS